MSRGLWSLVVVVVALVAALVAGCGRKPKSAPDGDGARVLDAFDDLTPWRATGSDGVRSSVRGVPGARGQALRLELDLAGTSGYAVARRALPLELPADFELSFELRGELPVNQLELKLIDESGDNVWWYRRASFEFPASWRHMTVKRRQIEFAWGPTQDRTLRRIAAIELVVAAGKGGGKGWVELDELVLRPRAAATTPPPRPVGTASSSAPGARPALALDGDLSTAWASDPAAGPAQRFTIDLGRERDLGGLLVRWADGGGATDYTVEISRDGAAWQPVAAVTGGDGGLDPFLLPESSGQTARFIRLALARGASAGGGGSGGGGGGYKLAEVELLDLEAGLSANAFITALAKRLPRGALPRGFSGEQPYWTIVGVDGGGLPALLSEDGALELGQVALGASIEPFVEHAGAVTSWATAGQIEQSLDEGYLPIPSVVWRAAAWELGITAVATGDADRARLAARYTLKNRTAAPITLRLVLAVRPLQVNPPTQFLNITGGVRRIERLAWQDGALVIDGTPAVHAVTPPDRVSLLPSHVVRFPAAPLPATAALPPASASAAISDPAGLASGVLVYDLALPPSGEATVVLAAPLAGSATPGAPGLPGSSTGADVTAWFEAQLEAARRSWHAALDRVGFRVPDAGEPVIATLRSSLAYMLLSRDGAILRPGTRSYARAWIRDGAMIGEALLRLGHPEPAADFLRWYAPYQFPSGKVPCCVEGTGAVPVPEHDSHGQLIVLAATLHRYTRDRARLAAVWPNVQAAARYLDEIRRSERTPQNQTPDRRPRYGLLPPSISHEGYSAKPAYSYWDDFWALAGYRDAVWIARELGDPAAASQLAAQRDEFQRDLLSSIIASAALHRTSYIPGAADLGDFDATSTTIALSPGGAQHLLPQDLLRGTFERAWREITARRPGGAAWDAYTPYELRLVGSFIRLGWRARAWDALAQYMGDRRPAAWNQWAEVVGRAAREPRFIGDMPHAWVHSDYARSVLDLFVYERDADQALVLAAGLPADWFVAGLTPAGAFPGPAPGAGFAIERLPTPYGPLSYSVSPGPRELTIQIGPGAVPPGGFVFPWPWPAPAPLAATPGPTRIDGRPARWRGDPPELVISQRPATIVISLGASPATLPATSPASPATREPEHRTP
jgi:F5/8 type C domain